MNGLRSARPTPALIVAMVALVAALSGAAVALPGKGTVKKNDIKNGAVTTKKIADAAVGSKQIKGKSIKGNRLKDGAVKAKQIADATITDKKIADGTITGAKVADDTLGDAKLRELEMVGDSYVRVEATDGANEAAARAAAPETVFFTKGELTVYAKCFRSTATDTTFAEVYSRTSADGAIQEGDDDLPGGNAAADFLNTDTAEEDRQLDTETATGNDANYDETEYSLASPDGTGLNGQLVVGAKNGNLAGGDGLYGGGNACIFQGSILG